MVGIRVVFSLVTNSGMSASSWEVNFSIMFWSFPICCYEWIEMYFCLRVFFQSLQLFSHFLNLFGFSVMISTFTYFVPKLFCFPCIRLLVYLRVFSPYLLVEFSIVVLECPVCLYCLILSRYLFSLPSFTSTFWCIASSCIVCSNRVALLFLSQHILAFFFCLRIFVCCRSFLICISSLIFPPGFQFLYGNPDFFTD